MSKTIDCIYLGSDWYWNLSHLPTTISCFSLPNGNILIILWNKRNTHRFVNDKYVLGAFPCPMLQIRWWGNTSVCDKRGVIFLAIAARGQCPAPGLNICGTCASRSEKKPCTQRLCLHSRLYFSSADAKLGLSEIFPVPKMFDYSLKYWNSLGDCLAYLA